MANETNPKTVSRSERTNAKNLENLHIANSIVESVGREYAPNNPLIIKIELTKFEDNFAAQTQTIANALSVEQNAVDAQLAGFQPASKKVTLIMKAVRAQGLEPGFVEGLQSNVNRLNGVRINKNTPAGEPDGTPGAADETPPTPVSSPASSVSNRSYAGILENLQMFAAQLTSKPAYNPNEAEYKSSAITAWVAGLAGLRDTALEAQTATRTARSERNAYIYNDTDGLLPRMTALKNYLGYILDKTDPRLKQIKSLKFTDNTK